MSKKWQYRRAGEPRRGLLVKLGGVLILAGLVANPPLLSSLAADGRVDGAARAVVIVVQVLLAGLGVASVAARSSPRVLGAAAALVGRAGGAVQAALFLVYLLLLLEGASWIFFHHVMDPDMRRRALFTAGMGTASGARLTPNVMPYLWSNYLPNPESDQVNRHGWRFGGGPRGSAIRILCTGGSTTWSDHASSPDASYPARLQAILRERGHDVEVISASAPYYSSAELVGMLAFRAIDTEPDIVLIHTGGNDVEPLLSPRPYRADYSHWRAVRERGFGAGPNDLFATSWKIPSWTVRLVSALSLRPDGWTRAKVGKQLTRAVESYTAANDVSGREPVGLRRNLRTLISIGRSRGARPVTILVPAPPEGNDEGSGRIRRPARGAGPRPAARRLGLCQEQRGDPGDLGGDGCPGDPLRHLQPVVGEFVDRSPASRRSRPRGEGRLHRGLAAGVGAAGEGGGKVEAPPRRAGLVQAAAPRVSGALSTLVTREEGGARRRAHGSCL